MNAQERQKEAAHALTHTLTCIGKKKSRIRQVNKEKLGKQRTNAVSSERRCAQWAETGSQECGKRVQCVRAITTHSVHAYIYMYVRTIRSIP